MPLWACVKEEREEEEERKEVKSLNRFTQPMLVSTIPEPWPGVNPECWVRNCHFTVILGSPFDGIRKETSIQ